MSFDDYVEFGFRSTFQGFTAGIFQGRGKADARGIVLGNKELPYAAVKALQTRGNRLIFAVDPTQVPQDLHNEIQQGYMVFEISSKHLQPTHDFINRQLSIQKANAQRLGLAKEGRLDEYRTESCPHCNSTINLSGFAPGRYIYCSHCQGLSRTDPVSGKRTALTADKAELCICEMCGYFGRIKEYKESNRQFLLVATFINTQYRKTCDACADEYARQNMLDGTRYIATKLKSSSGRDEIWKKLAQANTLAAKNDISGATTIYEELLGHWAGHPGLLFNQAMAHASVRKYAEAEVHAKRALASCPNYAPALQLMEQLDQVLKGSGVRPRPPQMRPPAPRPPYPGANRPTPQPPGANDSAR